MIKVENIDVWGFDHAIRGMRNPMNSWDKSDSHYCKDVSEDSPTCLKCEYYGDCNYNMCIEYYVGKNDLELMRNLYKVSLTGNHAHRKYLRQIFVSMDITAPLYWWKEADTYKIGTVANSCSTMHTIHKKEFELNDFSHEHLLYTGEGDNPIDYIIGILNLYRKRYIETKNKEYWWQLIQLLPSSYNQKRTVTMNYENVVTIIHQREGHRLDEWNEFCEVLKSLPYINEITKEDEA